MTRYARFHPTRHTTWPDRPVAVPPTWGLSVTAVGRSLIYDPELRLASLTIPDELVLRELFEVDVDSPAALAGFVAAHGITWGIDTPNLVILRSRMPPRRIDVEQVGRTLRVARCLVRHWIAHRSRRSVVKTWATEGLPVADVSAAWSDFVLYLNHGLEGMSPFFALPLKLTAPNRSASITIHDGTPHVDLYTALCLQLLNIVIEGLPPRGCANEPCPRYFVRQTGTAKYGQYRTKGVLYCSKSCAHAQAERERRRRIRKGSR